MIAIALIMEVEGSAFLSAVCIKESGIKIQDNSLRQLDALFGLFAGKLQIIEVNLTVW